MPKRARLARLGTYHFGMLRFLHIISIPPLVTFWTKHADIKSPLEIWISENVQQILSRLDRPLGDSRGGDEVSNVLQGCLRHGRNKIPEAFPLHKDMAS